MKLTDYIASDRGNAIKLAAAMKVSPSYLSQLAAGQRSVSPIRAVEIEKETLGAVSRKELRPDDWAQIWPELAHEVAA